MPSSSWPIAFLLLLCVLHTVRAAFTRSICNSSSQQYCVQKNPAGPWCFASTIVTQSTVCGLPHSIALAAHLKQDLSIAYYSPKGERLGGAEYPVPASTIVYLCASAELGPGQYHTMVALVLGDNDWNTPGCNVNLAPSHLSDGCFGKVSVPFFLTFQLG